jgi:hypothetical protein
VTLIDRRCPVDVTLDDTNAICRVSDCERA